MTLTLTHPARLAGADLDLDLDTDTDTDAEFARIVAELTRRGFLAGGLGSAALLGLAACGSSGPPATHPSSSTARAWSYTDDLGHTVHLPSTPRRIAVLANSLTLDLWAAGLRPIAAPLTELDATQSKAAGFSAAGIAGISDKDWDFNLEALTAARPDLLIDQSDGTTSFSIKNTPTLAKIAPVVAINTFTQPIDGVISSVERLVTALHMPLQDQNAKQTYQAAAARVHAAAAAKPDLRVAICFEGDNGANLLVATATGWPITRTLHQLGVTLTPAQGGGQYQTVSWELAPTLHADLLIYQNYDGTTAPTNPAWKQIPAVKAGQYQVVGPDWGGPDTYAYWAGVLTHLADLMNAAQPGVGPH